MKTAEEYVKELRFGNNVTPKELIEVLEQARMDAWKQGMTDALEYVESGGYQATAIELRRIRDNKK